MSVLLRSFFARGRPVLPRLIRLRTSRCAKRLGFSDEVTAFVVRANSSASASCAATQSLTETEDKPAVQLPGSSGVKFEENEKQYFHKVMETHTSYQSTIFNKLDLQSLIRETPSDITDLVEREDWSGATNQEIVEAFRLMTAYAIQNKLLISNTHFNTICSDISSRVSTFCDQEMLEIGKLHSLWNFPESSKEKNYLLLNDTLDTFCCSRYSKVWFSARDMTNILQAADVFYWQRLGSMNHYLRLIVYHLGMKIKEPHHLVQLLFYLGLMRNVPKTYKFYDLEKRVFSFKEHYSISELAIVVNALFRAKSRIQYYPLIEVLLVKSIKAFPSLDNTTIITICKGFSNLPEQLLPLLELFQKKLLGRIDDFNHEAVIHALWMSSLNKVVNEDLAQAVYERAVSNISQLRVKELTRVMILYTESLSPKRDLKRLAEGVLAELQDTSKSQWFLKKVFIQGGTLHRMLLCGLCPHDFLDEYFTKVNEGQGQNEALGIDVNLEVFHPNYKGTRLDPALREMIFNNRFGIGSKSFVKTGGKLGIRSTFNLKQTESMMDVLLDIVEGNKDCILTKQLVPSFGYKDVVLRIGKDGNYLPIPDEMREPKPWDLTAVPVQNLENGDKFVAITFCHSPNEYISKQISTFQREKVAILGKLGYIHIEMDLIDCLNQNRSFKMAAVLNKVAETLSNQSTA